MLNMIKLEPLLEANEEQAVILMKYIHSLSKSVLEDIAWNYALLQGDEDYKAASKFIKTEVKNIKRHNK